MTNDSRAASPASAVTQNTKVHGLPAEKDPKRSPKPHRLGQGWRWQVLTVEGLQHIKEHKYKPGVYTPLDNVLNGTWMRLTELLPRWLAPNLVTFFGFLPMVVSYGLCWWVEPGFANPPPRWLALYCGLALFLYQTFDAMDGKQARRTNSSSPLGQLFDHGCDCLACLSHHNMAALCLCPGGSRSGLMGLVFLQSGFFMAQWQEYFTGVLRTSFGPVGVTETQYGLMAMAFATAMLGPERHAEIFDSKVRVPWYSEALPLNHASMHVWVAFCGFLMMLSLRETFVAAHQLGKFGQSIAYLLPMVALNTVVLLWPSELLAKDVRTFSFVIGMLFFFYTAQMITFSMAKMAFPVWQPSLLPFGTLLGLSYVDSGRSYTHAGLSIFAVAIFIYILLWLGQLIAELKHKLGINVFTIGQPKSE